MAMVRHLLTLLDRALYRSPGLQVKGGDDLQNPEASHRVTGLEREDRLHRKSVLTPSILTIRR